MSENSFCGRAIEFYPEFITIHEDVGGERIPLPKKIKMKREVVVLPTEHYGALFLDTDGSMTLHISKED